MKLLITSEKMDHNVPHFNDGSQHLKIMVILVQRGTELKNFGQEWNLYI